MPTVNYTATVVFISNTNILAPLNILEKAYHDLSIEQMGGCVSES